MSVFHETLATISTEEIFSRIEYLRVDIYIVMPVENTNHKLHCVVLSVSKGLYRRFFSQSEMIFSYCKYMTGFIYGILCYCIYMKISIITTYTHTHTHIYI